MTEKKKRYSPEVKQRAVRMVFEHQSQYPSQWAAIGSIAGEFGGSAQTLCNWLRQAERDNRQREGMTSSESERLKALEGENRVSGKAGVVHSENGNL